MTEQHVWTDRAGNPWKPDAGSDECARCHRTPDAHIPTCGTPLGNRLVAGDWDEERGTIWRSEPYSCGRPARVRGDDGRMRCAQHDRMARGLSGKWVGPA